MTDDYLRHVSRLTMWGDDAVVVQRGLEDFGPRPKWNSSGSIISQLSAKLNSNSSLGPSKKAKQTDEWNRGLLSAEQEELTKV